MSEPNLRVFGLLAGLMLVSGEQSQANFETSRIATPLRRAVTPEDVARTIDFLVVHRGLPSQIVAVDAGESLLPRARDVAFDPALHEGKNGPP
jgi:hypothetical protein